MWTGSKTMNATNILVEIGQRVIDSYITSKVLAKLIPELQKHFLIFFGWFHNKALIFAQQNIFCID